LLFSLIIVSLLALILLGMPIGYALGSIGLILITIEGGHTSPIVITQRLFTGVDSFPLMAIPFFILAGKIMSKGNLSKSLIDFAYLLVGRIRGGLGFVAILSSMFFAALSGSAVATAAAIGGSLIPRMEKKGYDKGFSSALIASAAVVGPIIPPSIPMIVYGVTSGCSIGKLFVGGIFPGILIGLSLMGGTYIISAKRNYPRSKLKSSFKIIFKSFLFAFPALLMPIIILGGIYGGIFTPTEAAVVAVVYAFVIELFIYKDTNLKEMFQIITQSALESSVILFIIAAAASVAWVLTQAQIPQTITTNILSITNNKLTLLLLANLILLFAGCLMETNAAILILTPILVPILVHAGVDIIQIGIIMVVNLCIGLITPPLGMNIYVTANISKVKIGTILKNIIPFLILELVALLLITFIPEIVLYLPRLMGGSR